MGRITLESNALTNNRLMQVNSAILSTFIKPPFVIKIFVLSIFEWQFYLLVLLYRLK